LARQSDSAPQRILGRGMLNAGMVGDWF